MPKQKDLKRLVRARMEKTGEAYTAARLQLVRKVEPPPDYAALAGMSDASVSKQTGRGWAEWVRLLDAADAAKKPHSEIAKLVSSHGAGSWWAQTVTVGYERIRGLRARGQRRDGGYGANKSRTYDVPVEKLFAAFANARLRKRWLDARFTVKSATPPKRMRLACDDGTSVVIGFTSKGESKSSVAIQHESLPDRPSADAAKKMWGDSFDRLGEILS